jgi:CheY-like chemotaxis protein
MEYTLLHIEDDRALAKLVKTAFDSFGFKGKILSASTIHEGLNTLDECARLQKPLNLILTDMRLPDGTGLEVVRAVKSNPVWRLTPVVVLSGEKSGKVINDAYAMGANCFLPKTTKTGSVMGMLRSLYDCWLDSAVLPEGVAEENCLQATLVRWIHHRAQQANVYISLSQAFVEIPTLSRFWLDRALNEGNFTNMAVFFQQTLGEYDLPQADADRFVKMQARIDTALHTTELFLKKNARPTVDESLAIALDNLETIDETVITEFIHHILPRTPVAARTFQSALVDHFAKMASFIAERAERPNLRERASSLGVRLNKFKSTGPS